VKRWRPAGELLDGRDLTRRESPHVAVDDRPGCDSEDRQPRRAKERAGQAAPQPALQGGKTRRQRKAMTAPAAISESTAIGTQQPQGPQPIRM
jgi:hypothetical protein